MLTETKVIEATEEELKALSVKKILIILPHYNFRDKELTWFIEKLEPYSITYEIASTHLSDAEGRFGTIIKPDVLVSFVDSGDYDAFIFIGEEAAGEFIDNKDVERIIRNAFTTRKIVGAIGLAVQIIGLTGHLAGKKVTSAESQKIHLEEMGAFFTGRLVEQDGDLITANGPYAVREFTIDVIKALKWSVGNGSGRHYLR